MPAWDIALSLRFMVLILFSLLEVRKQDPRSKTFGVFQTHRLQDQKLWGVSDTEFLFIKI